MFMADNEFDEGDIAVPVSRYAPLENGRPATGQRPTTGSTRPSTGQSSLMMRDIDDEDETPSRGPDSATDSRARMLARQRELNLKKRQDSLSQGGMIRSSMDGPIGANSPARGPVDNQTTKPVAQFSRPKNLAEDGSVTASNEFTRNSTKTATAGPGPKSSRKGYDEDESGRPPRSSKSDHRSSADRSPRRDRDERGPKARQLSDDDDDSRGDSRRKGSNRDNRDTGSRSTRDRDYSDRDDRDYDRRGGSERRGGNRESDSDFDTRDTWGGKNSKRVDERDRDNYRGRDSRDNDDRRKQRGDSRDGRDDRDRRSSSRRGNDYSDDDNRPRKNRDDDRNPKSSTPSRSNREPNQWESADSRGGSNRDREQSNTPSRSATKKPAVVEDEEEPSQVFERPDYSNMRKFLTSPLPKNVGTLQCYIRRNKSGTNKIFPIYSLYLKEGDVFLMASKKRPKNKTSNYLISLDQNDLNRSGANYLGKLRSNFVGTEFQVFDNGVNPKDTEPDEVVRHDASVRCELGAVMYAANVLGSRGPRKMQVSLPGLDERGNIRQIKDGSSGNTAGEGDMLSRMKDRNMRDLVYLINKPPRWNEQVGAYVLNFNGRVTMASVKNFQLVDPEEQNAVVLQFGRVGKDEFTMDLQWPISPFQAFAVTLSSFDSKIACD